MHGGTSYTSGPWYSCQSLGQLRKPHSCATHLLRVGSTPTENPWLCGSSLNRTLLVTFNTWGLWDLGCWAACDLVSPVRAGAESQRALDSVLRRPQCFRTRVQLDPGAAGPGRLRDRRGPPIVSKHPALALQPGSLSPVLAPRGLPANNQQS